jgi:two-component system CheB/CheR fusion protein
VGGTPQRGLVVTFIDVSALWLERARLQGIIDSHPGRIAVLDQQGIIVLANAAWRTQGAPLLAASLGASELGAPYLELCDRVSDAGRPAAQRVRAALVDVLHHRAREQHVEYREGLDGAARAYLLSVSVLPGDTGGVVLSHLDVTARGAHPGGPAGKGGA